MSPKTLKVDTALLPERSSAQTALGLLGAVSFSLTFSTLSWSDEQQAARLIHAPLHRIPNSPEALNVWLGGEARKAREAALENLTWNGAVYDVSYPVEGFDGASLWIEEQGERISGEGAKPDLIVGVLRDITQTRQSEMRTAWTAHHDPLTKLWNRSRFVEALNYELAASDLRREPGYAAGLRLAGLDDVNTTIGHGAGDFLLGHLAKVLRERLPVPNAVARISADAFGLLLPGVSRADAEAKVKEIAQWIADKPHLSPFGDLYTGCDVSGLPLSAGFDTSSRLALLETQFRPFEKGIDFSAPDVPAFQARPDKITASDILSALHENRIALAYQPIIDAQTRQVNHFECLMRVIGHDGQPRSAAQLIMAAEELGYVHLLDRRALEIGSKTLKQYPDIHLAFNVSAGTIQTELAAERYMSALRGLGADTKRVTLELTETLALGDSLDASRFAGAARALGCRFAIDDFGAGHTTFQNLMSIEADIIKIDGSMVKDLSGATHKQTFVRMMVDLARTFGVETVAEMVNSEADAAIMTRMGVNYFQGYMFGMPAPVPDFDRSKQA